MLDQLIESRNHLSENRRRGSFLLTAFTAVASLFSLALIYSLFSYNLVMAGEKLDLSSLVAPVVLPADAPEPLEPKVETIKQAADKPSSNKPEIRLANIQRIEETPIKDQIAVSTERNTSAARPDGPFKIGKVENVNPSFGRENNATDSAGSGSPLGIKQQNKTEEIDNDAPPIIKKPTAKPVQAQTVIRTSKILNGQAKNLIIPPYPQVARAVHASGMVNVQVLIDENGNVTSANAVSGHPLLRPAAEQAARQSKFNPTLLNDQKVKVTGVIVYNFIAQ